MVSCLLAPENQIKGQGLGPGWRLLTQQRLKQIQQLWVAEMTELKFSSKLKQSLPSQNDKKKKKNITHFLASSSIQPCRYFCFLMPVFIPMQWRWTEFCLWCSQHWKTWLTPKSSHTDTWSGPLGITFLANYIPFYCNFSTWNSVISIVLVRKHWYLKTWATKTNYKT